MTDQDLGRQPIDEPTEGRRRLRNAVGAASGVLREGIGKRDQRLATRKGARIAIEDAAWSTRKRVLWPVEDRLDRLGRRGAIGVFGGGGIAAAGIVAAVLIAGSGGSGPKAGTTAAFVAPTRTAPAPVVEPSPRRKAAKKQTGPTLHGAAPDFSPAQDVREGVGGGKPLRRSGPTGGVAAGGDPSADQRTSTEGAEPGASIRARARAATASSAEVSNDAAAATAQVPNDAPASTAKIGSSPQASAAAQARTEGLATEGADETGEAPSVGASNAVGTDDLFGAPAPRPAKKVARRFAEAFVAYEVGGVDGTVREAFRRSATKQLSRSLLRRPPRQPAGVEVPKAKVVNVVAGPSKAGVYSVSVSLLRVGVTSELRLQMERGVGKAWQVTNVLG